MKKYSILAISITLFVVSGIFLTITLTNSKQNNNKTIIDLQKTENQCQNDKNTCKEALDKAEQLNENESTIQDLSKMQACSEEIIAKSKVDQNVLLGKKRLLVTTQDSKTSYVLSLTTEGETDCKYDITAKIEAVAAQIMGNMETIHYVEAHMIMSTEKQATQAYFILIRVDNNSIYTTDYAKFSKPVQILSPDKSGLAHIVWKTTSEDLYGNDQRFIFKIEPPPVGCVVMNEDCKKMEESMQLYAKENRGGFWMYTPSTKKLVKIGS